MKYFAMLTDFGLDDHYVAVMKSIFLSQFPDVRFIDISHQVPPQNISSAAYLLLASWNYLPRECLILAVVDPGVGSDRKICVLVQEKRILVCPDNGLAGQIRTNFEKIKCYETSSELIKKITIGHSQTFHGRDIFTPLAIWLAKNNINPEYFKTLDNPVEDPLCKALYPGNYEKQCSVIHIDHFGNLITNLKKDDNKDFLVKGLLWQHRFFSLQQTFSDVKQGEYLCYWGSSDFLEVALRNGKASLELGIEIGTVLNISYHNND